MRGQYRARESKREKERARERIREKERKGKRERKRTRERTIDINKQRDGEGERGREDSERTKETITTHQ